MDGQRSVLIVDPSEETREVLQTALERRGVRTLTAGRTDAGIELVRQHHPDLIVLDLELNDPRLSHASLPAFSRERSQQEGDYQPRLILLGSLRGWRSQVSDGEFVRKPYHFGPLIRKIEELLATDTPAGSFGPCQRCSSSAEPIKEAASS